MHEILDWIDTVTVPGWAVSVLAAAWLVFVFAVTAWRHRNDYRMEAGNGTEAELSHGHRSILRGRRQ
jgi:hypothetical protein